MSHTTPAPDVSGKIQSIDKQVDALRAAINRARQLRVIILLVLIAILVAIVVMFMNLAKRVTSEPFINEVALLSQQHFNENQSAYQTHVQQFVDRSYPILTNAFSEQATKDLPKFTEAFNQERDSFVNNLRARMDEKLTKKYQDLLVTHENLIVSEFPELKDKDKRDIVLVNFQRIIERIVARNYGDQFNDEAKKLIAIWDSFPAAKEVGPNDPTLEEKLLEHLLHVATGVMTIMQQGDTQALPPSTVPGVETTPAETTTTAATTPAETPATATPAGDAPAEPPKDGEAATATPTETPAEPPATPAESPAAPPADAPKDGGGSTPAESPAAPTEPPKQ
jgi:flagellar basal body-associated protein FliL